MKIRQAIVFALILGFVCFQSFRAGAAENSGTAAAQKEGKLVIYSSTDSASVEPLMQDFSRALYPFLQVEYNDQHHRSYTTALSPRRQREAAPRISCGARPWISSCNLPVKAMH